MRLQKIEHNGTTYTVKETIGIADMMGFVNDVIENVFDAETNEYIPEFLPLIIRMEVFKRYTDIEVPEDIGEAYDFVYSESDLYSTVLKHISPEQATDIMKAVDEKISYTIETKVNVVNKSVADISAKVEQLEKSLEGLFAEINPDDMAKIMNMVANYDTASVEVAKESFAKKRE